MPKKIIKVSKNPVTEIGMIKTVFGEKTEFDGILRFKTSLQINGKFRGEIISDGYLFIGKTAEVKANIKSRVVIIEGNVEGDIIADERLELKNTAKLIGNIKTRKLRIADGVLFEGNCEMIKDEEEEEIEEKE
jgi:cytoskeletal protein CcmA (bactofilin family)